MAFVVNGNSYSVAQFGNFIAGYGVGYSLDPLAHSLVRLADSWFGLDGMVTGELDWSNLILGGDNFDSVNFIEGGTVEGIMARFRSGKCGCP